MLEWLLTQLGLNHALVHNLGQAHLGFRQPWALWLGLPLTVVAGWFIFRRQRVASTAWLLRAVLTALRVAVLTLLVVVLAQPCLTLDVETRQKPILALLFDQSQSMGLPAGPFVADADAAALARAAGLPSDAEGRRSLDRLSRAGLARAVVQAGAADLWEPLSRQYDVRFFVFGAEAAALDGTAATLKLPDPPTPGAPATHAGDAVTHVLEQAAGRPVAGIVLFSDGQNTGGRPPTEAARAAHIAGTPLFTVPVGGAGRWADVAVTDVYTSGTVSVGDTAGVTVTVQSQGLDRRPIRVELREGTRVVDARDLTLSGGEPQQVELTFPATTPGVHTLTVHVPPLLEESELLRANNSQTAVVHVSGDKLKVLYIEGLPRWDFRFLKNAMLRDHGLAGWAGPRPDILLEAELRRLPPDRQAAALPQTVDQLAAYHAIILGDVSPRLLTPEFLDLLDQAVRQRGVGLIVQAGPLAMPHAFDATLHRLLPVLLRPGLPGIEPLAGRPFRVELTPEGSLQEALRFHEEPERNRGLWEHMPPYSWCAAAERPAPGATVLATNPSVEGKAGKLPLIASHFAGRGKVLFVGTDSTWTWRQNVGERFFSRFWGQSLRFVARRDDSAAKESSPEPLPEVRRGAEELRQPHVNRAALEQWAALSGGRVVELTELAKLPGWLSRDETSGGSVRLEETVWDNGLMLVLIVLLYSADVGLRRLKGLP